MTCTINVRGRGFFDSAELRLAGVVELHDFVGRGPLEIAGEFVHGPPETKPLLRCPPQSRLIDAAAADTLADLPAYLRVDGRVIDGARVPARRSGTFSAFAGGPT